MARGRAKQDEDTSVDTQPEFATVDDRYLEPARGERVRPVKRARFGVVVLTVLLTEIVLIAAGANQGVAKHLSSYSDDHPSSLLGHFVRSLLVFRWRFSPGGHTDLWHTELITVGLVLLLGIVLVPMVVHGPISWLRAFVGSWFTVTVSVAVATVAAVVLADLEESRDFSRYVVPGTPSTGLSVGAKIDGAVFGPVLAYAFVAGLALGLVVALITATVVVSTRRADPVPVVVATDPEPVSDPEEPQPFFGNAVEDDRPARGRGYGSPRYADAPYAESHPYAAPDRRATDETTTLPAVGATGGAAGYSAAGGSEPDRDAGDRDAGDRDAGDRATGDRADADRSIDPEARDRDRRSGFDRALGTPPAGSTAAGSTAAGSTAAGSTAAGSTAALPRVGTERPPARSEDTTGAMPSADDDPTEAPQAASEQPESPEPDPERTAAFPLPPDDEDLGHHPDHQDD